ncbi:MAG TPA: hypothetical protein P5550_11275, partial [Bacteroidales bacterium]|nr:hypothetical protein [Bacteroidales bacterium]
MSTSYNRSERLAAGLMARMPWAKKVAKKAYQRLNFAFYRREHHWDSPYVLRRFDHEGLETFYGYYDRSPESPDGRHLLFHAVNPPSTGMPLPEEIAWLVVYNLQEERPVFRCSTTSFNWQQGARALWVDDQHFIFNDYDAEADRHCSRLISLAHGRAVKTYPVPIYDVAGYVAVSLSFDRLQLLRPEYGYRDRAGKISLAQLNDEQDGITFLDLRSGAQRQLLSINALRSFEREDSFEDAHHWVNHLMLSPSGQSLMFLHRWRRGGRVHHRLMHMATDGSALRVLVSGMVSHCTWKGEDQIIGYMSPQGGPGEYYLLDLNSGTRRVIGQGVLDRYGDGHPGMRGEKMLFDTYPDRSRMKDLLLFELGDAMPERLGSFFEGFRYYGPSRCDLHPRWSRDGR